MMKDYAEINNSAAIDLAYHKMMRETLKHEVKNALKNYTDLDDAAAYAKSRLTKLYLISWIERIRNIFKIQEA